MNYEIEDVNISNTYKMGDYFVDTPELLYQIIYDSDRGYALLNVSKGVIKSEFHDHIDGLVKYTSIEDMRKVYQTKNAIFTVEKG